MSGALRRIATYPQTSDFRGLARARLVPLHRGFDGLRAAWLPSPNAGGFGSLGWTALVGNLPFIRPGVNGEVVP